MPSTPSFQVTVPLIRRRLRDIKGMNELRPEDLTDPEIEECIVLSIMNYNDDLPQSYYSNENFPDFTLLVDKTVLECLKILINWHSRNVNSSQDQGVQVLIHERAQYLQPIVDRLERDTAERQRRRKAAENLQNGFGGGVHSNIWGW